MCEGKLRGLLAHIVDAMAPGDIDVRSAQAQKLQTLGKLAASIAHDFNNLIAAILGSCDLLLARSLPADPAYDDLTQIHSTALRARELVRQLLAFARKQPADKLQV